FNVFLQSFYSQSRGKAVKQIVAETRGPLVCSILAGSWRYTHTHTLGISERQLNEVAPLLYGSGGAALGWWRVRDTDLRDSPSADVLHEAYRLQTLQSAIHEEKIKSVLRLLRGESIEAILVKGWAAAG